MRGVAAFAVDKYCPTACVLVDLLLQIVEHDKTHIGASVLPRPSPAVSCLFTCEHTCACTCMLLYADDAIRRGVDADINIDVDMDVDKGGRCYGNCIS